MVWKLLSENIVPQLNSLRENHSGMETSHIQFSSIEVSPLRENHSGMETRYGLFRFLGIILLRENHSGMETKDVIS